jgi:protein phosphatase
MGTTLTVALVEGDGSITFGHVGDSRAYFLRDGRLDQLTDDHSLVAELVRRGELSPAEAEVHPQRSVITRALGTDPDVDVDAFSFRPEEGDLFLICSDGLSDMVSSATIERILAGRRGDLGEAARELVRAANRGGGEDNITAVLFELVADGAVPPPPLSPDTPTREYAPSFDEEDTLHPEHGVVPPAAAEAPDGDGGRADTMILSAAELAAATSPTGPSPATAGTEAGTPSAGLGRRLLALAVIVALVALIVVLVWWGFAR